MIRRLVICAVLLIAPLLSTAPAQGADCNKAHTCPAKRHDYTWTGWAIGPYWDPNPQWYYGNWSCALPKKSRGDEPAITQYADVVYWCDWVSGP